MSVSKESSVREKLKEAGKHSVIYGIGSIAQSAAGLLLLPILTGALSKEDFGVYSLIIMISTIASSIFYLGMNSALPRSYYDYSAEIDRRAVFTTAFLILLVGSMIQVVLGVVAGDSFSLLLFESDRFGGAIFWSLLAGALNSINGLLFSYLRMMRKSVATIVYSLVSLVGSVGLTVLLLRSYPEDLRMPFVAMVITHGAIFLTFILLDGRRALCRRVLPAELPRLIPFGLASIFASFGGVLLEWMDRLFIQHYMTLEDVGDYSAIYRVASLVNVLVILPFTQIWSPMMMEYRDHANIKELFSRVLIYLVLAGSLMISCATLFAEILLGILVNSEVSSEMLESFGVVMLAILVLGTLNIFVGGLFYERKISYVVYAYYFVAAAKLLISFLLVPRYGIAGAAYSALLCSCLLVLVIRLVSKRYFFFSIDYKKIGVLALFLLIALILSAQFTLTPGIGTTVRLLSFFVIALIMLLSTLEIGIIRKAFSQFTRTIISDRR